MPDINELLRIKPINPEGGRSFGTNLSVSWKASDGPNEGNEVTVAQYTDASRLLLPLMTSFIGAASQPLSYLYSVTPRGNYGNYLSERRVVARLKPRRRSELRGSYCIDIILAE